jgi:predicted CopG family antitoxin
VQKKLTITISEEVYDALQAKIGAGRISRFIDRLVRAHVVEAGLREGYAAVAADAEREREAEGWTENLLPDADDAPR